VTAHGSGIVSTEGESVLTAAVSRTGVAAWPVMTAALGASCISASAILFTLANVDPVTATFYRCVLPLPVLGVLAAAEQRKHGPRPLASRGYAVVAGLFLAADLVLWLHSIADVGAGIATVLGNLQVLFVVAISWLALGERPARRYLILLPVVLLGVVLVSGMAGRGATGPHPLAGIAYGLGTSLAYSCFLLILRQTAGDARHVAGQLFDATVGAAAGALVFGLAVGGLQLAIPWRSLGWLLVLSVSSGIVGWLLITSSLPHLPAGLSSLLLLLQPALAMVLAAVVLGQRAEPIQIIGAVLVCGGVLMVARQRDEARVRDGPAEDVSSGIRATAPGPWE
jgi:drug/metabolite transporter (DMT)-like permease